MLIRPRPSPPYLPIYEPEDRPRIQDLYEQDERQWQREASFALWTGAIPVVCATIAVIVLAIMGPGIALDMISILAHPS